VVKKVYLFLMGFLCLFGSYTGAQSIDSVASSAKDIPSKYYSKVDKKINFVDEQLTKKSIKYLAKFQRQEVKLQRKMQKLNPELVIGSAEWGVGNFEAFEKNVRAIVFRLVTSAATNGESCVGSIPNRPVAGAAAEIARKLFVEIVVGTKIIAIIAFEKGTDETGRTIAALGAKAFSHRALNRMRSVAANAFHADDFATGEQADGHQATVHGAIGGFAVRAHFNDYDGARAAIAFGAAFLGAGEAAGAEKFEQGGVGRDVAKSNGAAVQNKF